MKLTRGRHSVARHDGRIVKVSVPPREEEDPSSRAFTTRLEQTPAGSPVLVVVPLERHPRQHQVDALIYEIAAELAKRSDQVDASWVVSAQPHDRRVVVEIVSDAELPPAIEMLRGFARDFDLELR